jgi:hypothetical protein
MLMVKGFTMEQSRQQSSSDDVHGKSSPHERKQMTKGELKKAYAEINLLIDECEEKRKELARRGDLSVACFVDNRLDVNGLVDAIRWQKASAADLSVHTEACCRVLHLISEQIKAAK